MAVPIRELMSTDVATVSLDAPLVNAVERLFVNRVSCVVVCSDDQLVGVISEFDVVGLAYQLLSGPDVVPEIFEVMTKNPVTIREDASLEAAIALVQKKGIRHLPVVDANGALVGMISHSDLLRACIEALAES